MDWTGGRVAALVVFLAAGTATGAGAQGAPQEPPLMQAAAPAHDGISGTVIDAQTLEPLSGVSVTLEARDGAAFITAEGGFLRRSLSATTGPAGDYVFHGVAPGEYRLHVQRLGYESASADVTFRGASASRVSFGLRVAPVALQPIVINTPPAVQVALPNASPVDRGTQAEQRVAAERARQDDYLPSDVRVISRADVAEGITLGETDLFRALQRLPGVSSVDEYSAELWLRGAAWDHTRVYFDGLPLFNPLHAAGVFSGVNADALGAALLHPGLQPTRLGGGAAASLELASRRTPLHPEHRTVGELSLVSARITTDLRSRDGGTSALASVRRTYLDWLTGAVEKLGGAKDAHVPYRFWDAMVRFERQIGSASSFEFSGLLELDELRGDVPDVLHQTRADWGGGATRVTLSTPLFGLRSRHTLGTSGFGSTIRELPESDEFSYTAPSTAPAKSSLLYTTLLGSVEGAAERWSAGYEIVRQSARYTGERPTLLGAPVLDPQPLRLREQATHGALWYERRWQPSDAFSLVTGVRAEAGAAADDASPVRFAPRVAARFQADRRLLLSAAYGRTYQYTQAVASAGVAPVKGFHGEYIYLPAGGDMPVLASDVITLGVERWLGSGWLGSVTLHGRRADGVSVPDPTPGNALDRPLFVTGRNTARGADFSLRRLSGRVTGSLAYAYGSSEMDVDGVRFPAPSDRRHVFDATAQLRVARNWLLGAAYTAATGAPYTRAFAGSMLCTYESCDWATEPWVGAPGAFRARGYQSLDLLAEWRRDFRGWQASAFLQVRNALNRSNQGRYVGFNPEYCATSCGSGVRGTWGYTEQDEFLPGAPVLPVLGFRFAF